MRYQYNIPTSYIARTVAIMEQENITDYEIRKWRNCTEEEKTKYFGTEGNALQAIYIGPMEKEALERKVWDKFFEENEA